MGGGVMVGGWSSLALVGALIMINGLFAGSEAALISLREGQIRELEQRGDRRSTTLVRLVRDPNRFLATIQIGITLAGFLASATAAVSMAERLAPALGLLGGAAEPVAVASVTLALTYFTLVAGELAPKRLAMQYARSWALLMARPLDVLSRLSSPAVWLLGATTDLVVRTFGGDPNTPTEQLSPSELRYLIASHRGLEREQRAIILGAFEIHDRVVREVLVPRRSVFTLPVDMPVTRARSALAASGHSRAPVVRGDQLDDTVGVVNLRDLIDHDAGLAEASRPAVVFPDSLRVADALHRFLDEREKFALVANEHGDIDGIVTLEDLLEEVVGEIYDEADRDIAAALWQPDGSLLLPGTFPVHDLPDLGVRIDDAPKGDYATIAGLVLTALGRIPSTVGERITLREWTIEIAGIDGNAISTVRLRCGDR
ncbi:hemolysin family protein [Nocardia otitidiscaviarum]|uniref:hemolysin family protein n=1 Tax=Nocardia otitidiscaviarum TaxID=1823 RepID=UPI002B4AD250|nr:hemolysin family protein [Nocardia otitidiscaviarum]